MTFSLANGYADASYKPISCVPGDVLEMQAMLLPVGAQAKIYAEYLDKTGAHVAYSANFSNVIPSQSVPTAAQQGTLAPFQLATLIDVVPSGAVSALFKVRTETTQSLATGYTFVTRTGLGKTFANASQVSPWSPGGVTSIGGGMNATESIVARNIATGAISADKVQVASASNVIGNPTCQVSSWGWTLGANAPGSVLGSVVADAIAPANFALAGEGSGADARHQHEHVAGDVGDVEPGWPGRRAV